MEKYKYLFIFVAILVIAGFYWFEIRPANIRKDCWDRIEDIKTDKITSAEFSSEYFQIKMGNQKTIDSYYANCLREKGI